MHKFKKHGRKQTNQQPGWMSESPTWVTTLKISGKVKRGLPFSRGVFSHDGKGDSQWSFTEREILTCSEGLRSFHQRCVRQLLKSYCVCVGSVPYPGGGGGMGGTPGNSWWGCAAQFLKFWSNFRPKSVIFQTHFQTRPLKSIPVSRPGL